VREGGGEMIREGEEANVNIMNCNFNSQSKASFKRKKGCSLKQRTSHHIMSLKKIIQSIIIGSN
jgi:hypothetical protein